MMSLNTLSILLAIATGAGLAVQAVVNSRLRVAIGSAFWAASVQTLIGLIMLAALAAAMRQPLPSASGLFRTPWWIWTGGLFGGTFVVVSILLTPRLGVALTLTAIIVGQLASAMVIDHFGWFGAETIRISPLRVVGAALLVAGVVLIRRSGL